MKANIFFVKDLATAGESILKIWKTLNPYRAKQIAAHNTFIFLLLSFKENKAWCFIWILCLAKDSHEISSLIFAEKQRKNIQDCRLLQW